MTLRDVRRQREADAIGVHRECGDERDRVVAGDLQALADVDVEVGVGVAVDARDVGEEDRVELGGLESLREVDPDPHVVELDLPGVGPTPLAVVDVRVRVHHEGVEVQWRGHVVLLGSKAGMDAMSCCV